MVLNLTKNNFDEVKNSKKPVLIDFFASWCGPCRMLSPVIDEIAEENPEYLICKVNVDKEPELARDFKILSIPTLAVLREGSLVTKTSGARPKEAILALLEA